MKSHAGVRLCTIGALVHDVNQSGREDLHTYRSLSAHVGRIYLIAISPDRLHRVSRSGNVIVISLARKTGALVNRAAFLAGAVRVGFRLYRGSGLDIYAASDPLFSGLTGLVLRRLTHKPLLVHLQGQLLDLPPGGASGLRRWAMVRLARFVCRRADMIRCVSKGLRDTAIASGVSSSRVFYLPSRVDTDAFSPEQVRKWRSTTREELDADGSKLLLFVGTLSPFKGVEALLIALPSVLGIRPDAKVVLVGSGPSESRLRELAQRLGVADKVQFLGRRPHDQMPRLLAAADVLVLPSLNEGLPRVVLEAMASGVPIVATSVGGIPEVVEDGRTGLLVPPADHAALADAICRVLGDPVTAQAWGRAGREVAERGYEREANIRKYAQLVQSVARAGRNRHHR